jgi:uncharacterized protein
LGAVDATVTAIWTTPVKGLRLHARDQVELSTRGVLDNRVFFLVDDRGTLVNGKRAGTLTALRADWHPEEAELSLTLPDGRVLSERVVDSDPFEVKFFSRRPQATRVCPELSGAISEFVGQSLHLVRADPALLASDRGLGGSVSLLSLGSLRHLGDLAGAPVDSRRFRMLFDVEGLDAHAEDALVGREVRVGSATVRFNGHVGRCRITKMDPDTGDITLETLDLLAGYRKDLDTTEPLAFGIYGEVLEPGAVAVGDRLIQTG